MSRARVPACVALGAGVRLASPWLLAPMEGITDPDYRNAVAALGGVGAMVTVYARITDAPHGRRPLRRRLGPKPDACPVGLQLMAAAPDWVAQTALHARDVGADFIDLNFGCPAPAVVGKGAGSGMLARPRRLGAIVAAAAGADAGPVTVKLRAGIDDDARFVDCLRAARDHGAAALVVHARLRRHAYHEPADWRWIAQAVAVAGSVPVIGNGSVATPADAHRMRRETGCAAVMIGRGAVADPWIFRRLAGGPPATRAEARAWLLARFDHRQAVSGPRAALGRIKQILTHFDAGVVDAVRRQRLLRIGDPAALRAALGEF